MEKVLLFMYKTKCAKKTGQMACEFVTYGQMCQDW